MVFFCVFLCVFLFLGGGRLAWDGDTDSDCLYFVKLISHLEQICIYCKSFSGEKS